MSFQSLVLDPQPLPITTIPGPNPIKIFLRIITVRSFLSTLIGCSKISNNKSALIRA